jgi:hypothetical protein
MPDLTEYLDDVLNGEFSADQRTFIARLFSDYLADYHPLTRTDYRIAARRCLRVLLAIDSKMSSSENPERTWKEISIALGLPSACFSQITQASVGRSVGVTKMAISKQVRSFLKLAELKPAFGCGSKPALRS